MNVTLTPELELIVHAKVRTGRYNSAIEVVREAIRLLDERDQFTDLQKHDIRGKIDEGLSSLREGKGIDGEAFMAQMMTEVDEEIRVEEERSAVRDSTGHR